MARISAARVGIALAAAIGAIALTVTPALAEPPPNDDFDSAVVITQLPFQEVTFTTEATKATDDPNCSSGARTVWYSYTPDHDLRVDVSTFGSNYDTTVGVYTGVRGSLNQVACNDDFGGTKQSSIRFSASSGTTYHFMIGSLASGVAGTLKLAVTEAPPPPKNDTLGNATQIQSLPFSDRIDTREATVDPGDPTCQEGINTVWYSFFAPKDMRVSFNGYGSDYSTAVAVYVNSGGSLRSLACSGSGAVVFQAKRNVTYDIQVGAVSGYQGGTLQVHAQVIKPPVKIHIELSDEGLVNKITGVARITGTVTCSSSVTVSVDGSLVQRQGSFLTTGTASRRVACKGKKAWAMTITGGNRAFRPALAGAKVSARPRGEGNRDSDSGIVRLRGCVCSWGL